MKTLANCSPREFLVQTNRIRKAVESWLTMTKIMEIRKNLPNIPEGTPDDERRELTVAQMKANANAMLDAALDEHPNETAELLGLMCFVEPEDLDNHKMTEFFSAVNEMMNCREILDFFISLTRLARGNTSPAAKA